MATWRTVRALSAAAMLLLAGCGSSSDSTSEGDDAAADANKNAAAEYGDGTEFYRYVPRKTRPDAAARTEVKPALVGTEKFKYPSQSDAPEVIADVTVFSDRSFVFDGDFEEYHSDGKTKHAVGEFKDDHRHGKWIYYHPDGKVAREVNYVDGLLDGTWAHFSKEGAKEMDVSYKQGKRHGTWIIYGKPDENGKQPVIQTTQFVDGKLNGVTTQFHANGNKRVEQEFKDGQAQGKQTAWYQDGTKAYEVTFEKGVRNGVETMWDEKGAVVKQREFRDGKPLLTAADDATATASASPTK